MSFIHFGCWNNGNCNIKDNNNGISLLMEYLLKGDYNPDFYVIAGDNYYPEKKEDNKIFNYQNFLSGFDCIRLLNQKAPIYMLMGNHDLQYENNLYNIENEKIDKCSVIEEEILQSKNLNFGRYGTMLNDFTVCLFLNTIFYTDDRDESIDCIKKYKPELNHMDSIEKIINYEENVLENLLNLIKDSYDIKNIVLIAHDPIVYRKEKPEKIDDNGKITPQKSVRKPLNLQGIEFINKLFNIIPQSNKYYLCADVHQYQKGNIKLGEHQIIQYVVGTGGAKQDKLCSPINYDTEIIIKEKINVEFRLLECQVSFGFLYCQSEGEDIMFDFIPVKDRKKNDIQILSLVNRRQRPKRNIFTMRNEINRLGGKKTKKQFAYNNSDYLK